MARVIDGMVFSGISPRVPRWPSFANFGSGAPADVVLDDVHPVSTYSAAPESSIKKEKCFLIDIIIAERYFNLFIKWLRQYYQKRYPAGSGLYMLVE